DLLGLQGWEVVPGGVSVSEDEVVVSVVRSEGTCYQCQGCGQGFLMAYDHRPTRRVRDFSVFGKRCWLEFTPARISCPECGVKVERLAWLEPSARQTLRYERYIAVLCQLMPGLDVAELEGLDKDTVYAIDKKWL